jgi:hypothetical protein
MRTYSHLSDQGIGNAAKPSLAAVQESFNLKNENSKDLDF